MPETAIRTASRVRQEFLDFFTEKYGHTFAPSSPVVPHEDPTLLFTNAGMNQFKDVFLGQGDRPYKRAVNTQKCIRAGGKHNDLEDVGKDTYHHTFFEMLGNWSFGDYFKREAIQWAWELLTEVWGLDKDRLYVTVFAGDSDDGLEPDEEAEQLWKDVTDVNPDHISRWDKKDNFWEMGDTGPCGPCSEIHYDSRPDDERAQKPGALLVNRDDPHVIELWNLVFIQFNRDNHGKLTPLPAMHVDTGMGFERIVRALQGKDSNYDTDVFTPIFEAIRERTGAREYQGAMDDPVDIAYRVIADHIRCLTVAITDGATPGNEGRAYVLRRILRRAVRHARQTLHVSGTLLCELVPSVVDSLGESFPELKKNPKRVVTIIEEEEKAFLRTIDRGIELFDQISASTIAYQYGHEQGWTPVGSISTQFSFVDNKGSQHQVDVSEQSAHFLASKCSNKPMFAADAAFKLHDTYGFPIDLTCVMAEERGMTVDVEGFERLMEKAREKSRAKAAHEEDMTLPPDAIEKLKRAHIEPTDDHFKYAQRPIMAKVKAIWNGSDFDNMASVNRHVALITDKTNFYAEQGGQVGDRGFMHDDYESPVGSTAGEEPMHFQVHETRMVGGFVLHIGHVTQGEVHVGDDLELHVDRQQRDPTRANHTATHMLNFALRKVIAEDVDQKGSLVAPDRLRFDFSCPKALTPVEIERVETIVNDLIEQDLAVHAETVPLKIAQKIHGVRAVFGEKYPDPVRVIAIGTPVDAIVKDLENEKWTDYSIEFCGGTHLQNTKEANHFVIVKEEALAAGIRRITALTGTAAKAADMAGHELLQRLKQARSLVGKNLLTEFDEVSVLAEQITTGAVLRQKIHRVLDELREKVKSVRKQSKASAREQVVEQARTIAADARNGDVIVDRIDSADKDTLLAAMDVLRAKHPDSPVMLFTADEGEGKVQIVAAVPKPLIEKGLKAGDWVRGAAQTCGGGGGGRPDMAQAGGKDPSKIKKAIKLSRERAQEMLQ